jgi:ABC-type multidrug transport system ATPase subunit
MLAVMGPSGAGKSTFLDVLSRRKADLVNGKVYLGSKEVLTTAQMATVGSYVEQEDDLLGVLTVKETIAFAARLNLPDESKEGINERVTQIITALGLTKCANQIVGNP